MDLPALTAFFARTPLHYLATDATGHITAGNTPAARLFGCALEELYGAPLHMYVVLPDTAIRPDRTTVSPSGPPPLSHYHPAAIEVATWCAASDTPMRMHTLFTPALDAAGRVTGYLIVGMPPTLQQDEDYAVLFHAFMHHAPMIAFIKDHHGRLRYVNPPFLDRFAVSLDALLGKTDFELWPPEIAQTLFMTDQEILTSNIPLCVEETVPTPDGSATTWLSFKFPLVDRVGRKLLGGMAIDITERKRVEDQLTAYQQQLEALVTQLEQVARLDSLSGLAHRGTFWQRANEEVARTHRHSQPLAVITLDIDAFKEYNDTFGHLAGDAVIQTVATHLTSEVRAHDLAARVGGEEFALLLPQTTLAGAVIVAERLRQRIQAASWPYRAITVSLGVTACVAGHDTVETFLARADQALYRAKHHGRNKVWSDIADAPAGSTSA